MIGESVLDDVARHLNVAPDALRENHLYHEGDLTHFGQKLIDCQVRSCWEELKCKREASFVDRRKAVETFNQTSKFKKRGFAATPAKFGIAFTALFLNQAGALVNVYLDGTVGVSIGGVEMGQGLFVRKWRTSPRNTWAFVSKMFTSSRRARRKYRTHHRQLLLRVRTCTATPPRTRVCKSWNA